MTALLPFLARAFASLFGVAVPVRIVDVGANVVDGQHSCVPMLADEAASDMQVHLPIVERENETYLARTIKGGHALALRFCAVKTVRLSAVG